MMRIAAILLSAVSASVASSDPYAAYGPLRGLIGTWHGIRGKVRNPRPNRYDCYTERTTFTPMFPVVNKDVDETVYALRYEVEAWHLDGTPIHHEVGEWQWHPKLNRVLRASVIPRGQTFQALGTAESEESTGGVTLRVSANSNGVVNSPAFAPNARILAFEGRYHVDGDTLWYNDSSLLDYNGAPFAHSDANCLARSSGPQGPAGYGCPKVDLFCEEEVQALPVGFAAAGVTTNNRAALGLTQSATPERQMVGKSTTLWKRVTGWPVLLGATVAGLWVIYSRRQRQSPSSEFFTEL